MGHPQSSCPFHQSFGTPTKLINITGSGFVTIGTIAANSGTAGTTLTIDGSTNTAGMAVDASNSTIVANITAPSAASTIVGSGGADTIVGGAGADVIYADNSGTREVQTVTITYVGNGTDTLVINGQTITYLGNTNATTAAAASFGSELWDELWDTHKAHATSNTYAADR